MIRPCLSLSPNPEELRPPLVTLDMAAVGYTEGNPILRRLNLRLDPDDRIALLGRNGNGKTTLARLLAAQLTPMEGEMTASGKMRVGYFTQYQVEELDTTDTPLEHMTRVMTGMSPAAVRAQLGRFGFSGQKATTKVGSLSGGERARLALALITRDAPHMLILDEPTNHLDVDAREALVQALNAYEGAVVIVSHDRHMIELTADRLVLVDGGVANEYNGQHGGLYRLRALRRQFVRRRQQGQEQQEGRPQGRSRCAREECRAKEARARGRSHGRQAHHPAQRDRSGDVRPPRPPSPWLAKLGMSDLMKRRAEVAAKLEVAEAAWLQVSEELETVEA